MASHVFDLPVPRTFLQKMSLRTGAEIITFLQVINKVSGLYGLLALLTGAHLTGWQLSMYLYSNVVLVATVWLYKHIRLQSPFQVLLLAHLYALDSVVNALFTAFFGVAWFYVLASHPNEASSMPGADGIIDNAGFTSPKYNVSHVEIVAEPANGLPSGQNAVAVGQGTGSGAAGLGNAVFQSGSIMSITLIAGFWALRVYFVFIMLAFARQCLRQHIASNASTAAWYNSNTTEPNAQNLAENPFEEDKEEGHGWKGKVGRIMLSGAPQYWLGADEDGEWMRGVGGKFRKTLNSEQQPLALGERERRRRSGTGPPAPPRELRIAPLADLQEVR
ncbi:Inositolphosphorylceramide synthase subunit Kei1-domain-containing protein [Massariosphaeria phaeospora]|uniref:Inositolphosphorylceramide synthase subunit Kei1-domain-containing protein n=1 Tax=Massariosphaeria phaeospora TaxID=100035 RepID=A0A7C8MA86_9PLEO|nr:Inositolphosphorylceramide synthase subunit Kei1-domain-containing protein [Massariosphaeria phaeospora]